MIYFEQQWRLTVLHWIYQIISTLFLSFKVEHYKLVFLFVSDQRLNETLRRYQMENFFKYSTVQVCKLNWGLTN